MGRSGSAVRNSRGSLPHVRSPRPRPGSRRSDVGGGAVDDSAPLARHGLCGPRSLAPAPAMAGRSWPIRPDALWTVRWTRSLLFRVLRCRSRRCKMARDVLRRYAMFRDEFLGCPAVIKGAESFDASSDVHSSGGNHGPRGAGAAMLDATRNRSNLLTPQAYRQAPLKHTRSI